MNARLLRASERNHCGGRVFRQHPGFSDYLACMLQDLQYTEADEACTEERDSGTIYTLPEEPYAASLADWQAFVAAAGDDGEAFADALGWEMLGSDFWLTRVGHGAGFWDRGQGEVGERLTSLVGHGTKFPNVDPYFGDDGEVWLA